MAHIQAVRGISPVFGLGCFLAPNAVIVGNVVMGDACSVWFHAVVRGDVHSIRLGNRVNVQDGAIIHCTYEKASVTIGDNVSIGHRAIVHGCDVEDNVLIGMGAIVMDHCLVKTGCIIAAGAVLTQGTETESGWIYAGVPARKVKPLDTSAFAGEIDRIAKNYVMYAGWFAE